MREAVTDSSWIHMQGYCISFITGVIYKRINEFFVNKNFNS